MELTSKVFALGNSNAVRIPQVIMDALSLHTNDPIVIDVTDKEEVRIRKLKMEEPYPSVRTLFKDYEGSYHPGEMDSGGIVGREMI